MTSGWWSLLWTHLGNDCTTSNFTTKALLCVLVSEAVPLSCLFSSGMRNWIIQWLYLNSSDVITGYQQQQHQVLLLILWLRDYILVQDLIFIRLLIHNSSCVLSRLGFKPLSSKVVIHYFVVCTSTLYIVAAEEKKSTLLRCIFLLFCICVE